MESTSCYELQQYSYGICRTRESLCRIWKSIILHDVKSLKEESSKFGVDSESACKRH